MTTRKASVTAADYKKGYDRLCHNYVALAKEAHDNQCRLQQRVSFLESLIAPLVGSAVCERRRLDFCDGPHTGCFCGDQAAQLKHLRQEIEDAGDLLVLDYWPPEEEGLPHQP